MATKRMLTPTTTAIVTRLCLLGLIVMVTLVRAQQPATVDTDPNDLDPASVITAANFGAQADFQNALLVTGLTDYHGVIFQYNSTTGDFTPVRTVDGTTMTTRCNTGVEGNLINFSELNNDGLSNTTLYVSCGGEVVTMGFEWVAQTPRSVVVARIESSAILTQSSDTIVAQLSDLEAGGNANYISMGTLGSNYIAKRSQEFSSSYAEQRKGRTHLLPESNAARTTKSNSNNNDRKRGGGVTSNAKKNTNNNSQKKNQDNNQGGIPPHHSDPGVADYLKVKPDKQGRKTFATFEGDLYRHLAETAGKGNDLQKIKKTTYLRDDTKKDGYKKMVAHEWRLKGMDESEDHEEIDNVEETKPNNHRQRRSVVMMNEDGDTSQESHDPTTTTTSKPSFVTNKDYKPPKVFHGYTEETVVQHVKRSTLKNDLESELGQMLIPKLHAIQEMYDDLDGDDEEEEEGGTNLRRQRRSATLSAQEAVTNSISSADYDIFRATGSSCASLTALNGGVGGSTSDCTESVTVTSSSLGDASLQPVAAAAKKTAQETLNLLNLDGLTSEEQSVAQIATLINYILGLQQEQVVIQQNEIDAIERAIVDNSYAFAGLLAANAKFADAVASLSTGLAKTVTSLQGLALIVNQNAAQTAANFEAAALVTRQSFTILQTELIAKSETAKAATSFAIAQLTYLIAMQDIAHRQAIAESKIDSDVIAAQNTDDSNIANNQLVQAIRDMQQQLGLITARLDDHDNAILDLQQNAFGVGNVAVQLYIYLNILTSAILSSTSTSGIITNSTYALFALDNGIPTPDVDRAEIIDGSLVTLSVLDPGTPLIECDESGAVNDYVINGLAATARLKLMAPIGYIPEFIKSGFVPVVTGSTAAAPSILNPTPVFYYLVGTTLAGTQYFIYVDGTGALQATTSYATAAAATFWEIGALSSRSVQDVDALRSLAVVILRSTLSSVSTYLSVTSGTTLSVVTTSTSTAFLAEPIVPGELSFYGLPNQKIRNFAYANGTALRHNRPLFLLPTTVSAYPAQVYNPLPVIQVTPPMLVTTSPSTVTYLYFTLLDTRFALNNDSNIFEYPLTEAQTNETVSSIPENDAPFRKRSKRDLDSALNSVIVATVDDCFMAPDIFPGGSPAVQTPAGLASFFPAAYSHMKTCIGKPGCQYQQHQAPVAMKVEITSGGDETVAYYEQTTTYRNNVPPLITRLTVPPSINVGIYIYNDSVASDNYHCASAIATCHYIIRVNYCQPVYTSTAAGYSLAYLQSHCSESWLSDRAPSSGAIDTSSTITAKVLEITSGNRGRMVCSLAGYSGHYCAVVARPGNEPHGVSSQTNQVSTTRFSPNLPNGGVVDNGSNGCGYLVQSGNTLLVYSTSAGQNVESPQLNLFTNQGLGNQLATYQDQYQCIKCDTGYGVDSSGTPANGLQGTTGACPKYNPPSLGSLGGISGNFYLPNSGVTTPYPYNFVSYTFAQPNVLSSSNVWGTCVPQNSAAGNGALDSRAISFPYFVRPNDTGTDNVYDANVLVRYVTRPCDTYLALDCLTDPQIFGLCKLRISLSDNTFDDLTTLSTTQQECVSIDIPDRCVNITSPADCINHPLYSSTWGYTTTICGWDNVASKCRELDPIDDDVLFQLGSSFTLSAPIRLRNTNSLQACTFDGLAYQTLFFDSISSYQQCFPIFVDTSVILNVANSIWFRFVANASIAENTLSTLVGMNDSFDLSQCLTNTMFCRFSSELYTLRLHELLNVVYPELAAGIVCAAMPSMTELWPCANRKLIRASTLTGLTGANYEDAILLGDQVVSLCTSIVTGATCANSCINTGLNKDFSACIADPYCYEDQNTLDCFNAVNSDEVCPGYDSGAQTTDWGSTCIGPFNRCNIFSATNFMNGTFGNFSAPADYLNSQCVQASGFTCGDLSRTGHNDTEARIRGANFDSSGFNSLANECVVYFAEGGPVCYPRELVTWCTMFSTTSGCSASNDVCALNSQAAISQALVDLAASSNCFVFSSDLPTCVLTIRPNDTTSDSCLWIQAATKYGFCGNKQYVQDMFGSTGDPRYTIYDSSTYLQSVAQYSDLINATYNEILTIGIDESMIYIPKAGTSLDIHNPALKGKIIEIEPIEIVCPDPTMIVVGRMCCPVSGPCDGVTEVKNENHPHWLRLAAHEIYCPSIGILGMADASIYTGCQQRRAVSQNSSDPIMTYLVCEPYADPNLAAALFNFANASQQVSTTAYFRGRAPQRSVNVLPLKTYQGRVVSSVTYPSLTAGGPVRTYPVYGAINYPSWATLRGSTFTFLGNTWEVDNVLNITVQSLALNENPLTLRDIKDVTSAALNGANGWFIDSTTAKSLHRMVDQTISVFQKSHSALYGPDYAAWITRPPTACVSEVLAPGTALDGRASTKTNVLYCLFYETQFVDVYRIQSVTVTTDGFIISSDQPGVTISPVAATVTRKGTDARLPQAGDHFIMQQYYDTVIGVSDDNIGIGVEGTVTYIADNSPIYDVETILDRQADFHPLDGKNSPRSYEVDRLPTRKIGDIQWACGEGVTATQVTYGARRARMRAVFNVDELVLNPMLNYTLAPFLTNFSNSILDTAEALYALIQKAFNAAGCVGRWVNSELEVGNSNIDQVTLIFTQFINFTSSTADYPGILAMFQTIAQTKDHVTCGNCIVITDKITGEVIFNDNQPIGDPQRGCNPKFGTVRPQAPRDAFILDGSTDEMPYCDFAFDFEFTDFQLNGRDGGYSGAVAKSRPRTGVVDSTFILPKLGTVYQESSQGACLIVTNGSALAGSGVVVYEITNPTKMGVMNTVYMTVFAPTDLSGDLNTTISLPAGDANNYLQNVFVPPLSTITMELDVASTSLHYWQLFALDFSSNCSQIFVTSIDYQTVYIENRDTVIVISDSYDTAVLTNRRNFDLTLEKQLQDFTSNFTVQQITLRESLATIGSSVGDIADLAGRIITNITNLDTSFTDAINNLTQFVGIVNNNATGAIIDIGNDLERVKNQTNAGLEIISGVVDDVRNTTIGLSNDLATQRSALANVTQQIADARALLDTLILLIGQDTDSLNQTKQLLDLIQGVDWQFTPAGAYQADMNVWIWAIIGLSYLYNIGNMAGWIVMGCKRKSEIEDMKRWASLDPTGKPAPGGLARMIEEIAGRRNPNAQQGMSSPPPMGGATYIFSNPGAAPAPPPPPYMQQQQQQPYYMPQQQQQQQQSPFGSSPQGVSYGKPDPFEQQPSYPYLVGGKNNEGGGGGGTFNDPISKTRKLPQVHQPSRQGTYIPREINWDDNSVVLPLHTTGPKPFKGH